MSKKGYTNFVNYQDQSMKLYRITDCSSDRMAVEYSIDNDEKIKNRYSRKRRQIIALIVILLVIFYVYSSALIFLKYGSQNPFFLWYLIIGAICAGFGIFIADYCIFQNIIRYSQTEIDKARNEIRIKTVSNAGKEKLAVIIFERVVKFIIGYNAKFNTIRIGFFVKPDKSIKAWFASHAFYPPVVLYTLYFGRPIEGISDIESYMSELLGRNN